MTAPVQSRIHRARVSHERHGPVTHRFEYPAPVCVFDLDELPRLDRETPGFGHNRASLLSLRDADHLDEGDAPLKDKLLALLARFQVETAAVARVLLLTSARFLGRLFNPVSFWFCHDAGGGLVACVAEVNNTFGDRHAYVLRPGEGTGHAAPPWRFRAAKAMHVSPFFDMRGEYAFTLADIRRELDVTVVLEREGVPALTARLVQEGEGLPFTGRGLWRAFSRLPLSGALTMPRIINQAFTLRFSKKLPVHPRPWPLHPHTIRKAPWPTGPLLDWPRRLLGRALSRLEAGSLTLVSPDGSRQVHGGAAPGPAAEIQVHDRRFFRMTALDGDIGLGDAYVAGHWDSPDLDAVFDVFLANRHRLSIRHALGLPPWLLHLAHAAQGYRQRRNDRAGSQANIHAHYDLSNELFASFLDPTLFYSAAVFADLDRPVIEGDLAGDDLEEAQHRKARLLLEATATRPGDRILEIGCGWGGFALEAAGQGRRVMGVTVSRRQLERARERVAAAGLQDLAALELMDYRDVTGTFDAVASIEMLEAVGHEYHAAFFETVDRALKPGGRAAIQVITIQDQRYESYRRSGDWIRKRIFPGGLLPSLTRLCEVATRRTSLHLEQATDIGPHYVRTLRLWRNRFLAAWPRVEALGFDERFRRMWLYYLASCEAGFRHGHIQDWQLAYRKPLHAAR